MLGKLKGFISETAFYGLANVFSRFFVFFLTPLYIGLLGNECYANITIYQLIFTVASYTFALNSGVFFYYYDYTRNLLRNKIFATWVYYQIFAFIVLFGAGILFRNSILSMIDITPLPGDGHAVALRALIFMLLQFIPFVVVNTYKNFCRIQLKAKIVMWITLGETIFSVLFIVIFVRFMHMNVDGVMLGQLVGRGILIPFVMTKDFRASFNFTLFSFPLMKRLVNYSWPFFVISVFSWVMSSVDKFVGSAQDTANSHEQVAYMSLAALIVMPITLLVEVIRQSIGPFVMNIKNEKDSRETYSLIFTFVLLISLVLSTVVLAASPLLIQILSARKIEFYQCLTIIPMLVMASIMSVAIGQFSIGCSLTKKNIYIAIGSIIGGLIGFGINVVFQPRIGILASGIGQICSYLVSMVILFYFSHKFYKIDYEWKWIAAITTMFIAEFAVFTGASFFHSYHILVYSVIGFAFLLINLYMMERKFHLTQTLKNRLNLDTDNRIVKSAVIASLGVVLLAASFWGYHKFHSRAASQVTKGNMKDHEGISVSSVAAGLVSEIRFVNGQAVHKGDTIILIKTQATAALDSQQSIVDQAQAKLWKAQENYDKYTFLSHQGKATTKQLEEARIVKKECEKQMEQSTQKLSALPNDLDHSKVTAPDDGFLFALTLRKGQQVDSGQILFQIKAKTE